MAEPTSKAGEKKTDDSAKWRYGVVVVLAGLFVILVAFVVAVGQYDKASDVSTALAPITGVVGTIVGAYFGVQVGAAGKDKADAARDKSEAHTRKALLALAPDSPEARELRASI
jgi:hypothetical protein